MGFANVLVYAQSDERWRYSILQLTFKFKQLCDEKPKYVLSLLHFFDLNAELQFLCNIIQFSHSNLTILLGNLMALKQQGFRQKKPLFVFFSAYCRVLQLPY